MMKTLLKPALMVIFIIAFTGLKAQVRTGYVFGLQNIAPHTNFYTEMNNKVIGISISAGTPGLRTSFGR